MKIVRNKFIPPSGFKYINIFGVLFTHENVTIPFVDLNHESIHTAQMKELLYIPFYLIYLLEWLFRFLFTKDAFSHNAYKHISFEAEAYENEMDVNYLKNRKHFAQWRSKKS